MAFLTFALDSERLAGCYASSQAREAWALLVEPSPLTRAELALTLDVTACSASQLAIALEEAKLVAIRRGDSAIFLIEQRAV